MATKKRAYLNACMGQSIEWLTRSANNPSAYMTRMDIALHWLAIRKKTGI
jgi:hypothetical protein